MLLQQATAAGHEDLGGDGGEEGQELEVKRSCGRQW